MNLHSLLPHELESNEPWWKIYQESFPPEELEPREVILRSLHQGVGIAIEASQEGQATGLATIHLLRHPAAVFLVYLVVHPRARGMGSGSELFEYAWQVGKERLLEWGLEPLGMIWEVDLPSPGGSSQEVCDRRIRFFQRNGGDLLPRAYFQPPVNGTTAVPMRLMFRSPEGAGWPSPEQTESLVEAMYREKYGQVNGIANDLLEELVTRR